MSVTSSRITYSTPEWTDPERTQLRSGVLSVNGLTAFAPVWAIATLFSIGGDYGSLSGASGLLFAVPAWLLVALSLLLLVYPSSMLLLLSLSTTAVLLYVLRAPVASNNQTIATVMNGGILLSAAVLFRNPAGHGIIDRDLLYEQIRIVARSLLAIMYFYGIFHKINTDFLDPTVSCAVGLYVPLAKPFGLDANIVGRYIAIYATFIIEALAIIALYWRRFFAVGFILAIIFHYVIPISAYSWYMDFSSLVFALYLLSIPAPVNATAQQTAASIIRPLRERVGPFVRVMPGFGLVLTVIGFALLLATAYPEQSPAFLRHSIGILLWAIIGGLMMLVMTYAALQHFPYRGPQAPRQPRWLLVLPGLFFLSCLSPYIGLKTESSINMFSNLHTEAGQTNHLLFSEPPYFFGYQNEVVQIVDSSDPHLLNQAEDGNHHVLFALKDYLRRHPDAWVSYMQDGQLAENVTSADFAGAQPGLVERNLLPFKLVDFNRPKVCTH